MVRLNGRLLSGVSFLALSMAASALAPHTATAAACNSLTTATDPACTWSSGDLSISSGGTISGGAVGVTASGNSGALTNSGRIGGTVDGINNSGTISSIDNSSTIVGSGTAATNAAIKNTGTIDTITNSGVVNGTGNNAIQNNGASATIGTVTNSGTLTGPYRTFFNWGGTVGQLTNTATGTIVSSGNVGVTNSGVFGTLSNAGTITGATFEGAVSNFASSTFTLISNTGLIRGTSGQQGIYNAGTLNTISNSGSITGASSGIHNIATGTITTISNNAGGTITGPVNGVVNQGIITTFNNGGSVVGSSAGLYDAGVFNGGTINTLTNSGNVTGAGNGILNNTGATIGTLTNNGVVTGVGGANAAVYNRSGTITAIVNNAGATISGTNNGGLDNNNSAILGTVTNYGLITGTGYGVYNGAASTITTLDNIGTISGGTGVFLNGGAITALTNSGTITGTTNAINIAAGSIGTLTNSGVISGNIVNTPASVLTINGGSGSTFGTLTGGVITSTAANVVFGSGNILLEDNVNVTGRTLANTGATVKLTTGTVPTITGTYNQTAGGIWSSVAANGSNGWMSVTGNATVNNSTITISGTTMNVGDRYTIVKSGGVGTYTGDTAAVAGKGGLTASVITVGGTDLVVVLTAKDYGTITSTPPSNTTLLNKIATSTTTPATKFQIDVLSTLDNLSTTEQAKAIKQLEPSKNAPATQMAANAATVVLGAVEQHQQTVMAYDSAAGGAGKAAGSDIHDRAVWGEFLGGGAIRGSNAEADGYKTHNLGMAVGADQQFNKNAMAGVALSWMRSWSQGRDGSAGSSSTLDSYQLTLYGTYRLDRAFVDGQLAAGWNHFDQHRAIPFLGTGADATYNGQQYLAKATFGYDIPVTNATVTPLAGLRWLRAVHDGYTETGAGGANLEVDSGGVNYVSHDLGGKVSFSSPTDLGPLRTEIKLAWVHDYTHGAIPTTGLMGGETFASSTPRTKPDGARFGLAGTLNSDDDVSFRAEYEGEVRQQYQSHAGLVKAIWGF